MEVKEKTLEERKKRKAREASKYFMKRTKKR